MHRSVWWLSVALLSACWQQGATIKVKEVEEAISFVEGSNVTVRNKRGSKEILLVMFTGGGLRTENGTVDSLSSKPRIKKIGRHMDLGVALVDNFPGETLFWWRGNCTKPHVLTIKDRQTSEYYSKFAEAVKLLGQSYSGLNGPRHGGLETFSRIPTIRNLKTGKVKMLVEDADRNIHWRQRKGLFVVKMRNYDSSTYMWWNWLEGDCDVQWGTFRYEHYRHFLKEKFPQKFKRVPEVYLPTEGFDLRDIPEQRSRTYVRNVSTLLEEHGNMPAAKDVEEEIGDDDEREQTTLGMGAGDGKANETRTEGKTGGSGGEGSGAGGEGGGDGEGNLCPKTVSAAIEIYIEAFEDLTKYAKTQGCTKDTPCACPAIVMSLDYITELKKVFDKKGCPVALDALRMILPDADIPENCPPEDELLAFIKFSHNVKIGQKCPSEIQPYARMLGNATAKLANTAKGSECFKAGSCGCIEIFKVFEQSAIVDEILTLGQEGDDKIEAPPEETDEEKKANCPEKVTKAIKRFYTRAKGLTNALEKSKCTKEQPCGCSRANEFFKEVAKVKYFLVPDEGGASQARTDADLQKMMAAEELSTAKGPPCSSLAFGNIYKLEAEVQLLLVALGKNGCKEPPLKCSCPYVNHPLKLVADAKELIAKAEP